MTLIAALTSHLPTIRFGSPTALGRSRNDPDAITERIHRQVRGIEIQARALLAESFVGDFQSAFRGRGLEFAEIRQYLPGDDVRFIDWNVTARRRTPYIKQYVEERERTVLLLIDVSASESFGTTGRSVRSYAVELAGLLGFAAALSNDRVGALAFSDQTEYLLPPRKGHRHVLRMLHDLLTLEPRSTGTDLARAIDEAGRVVRRGGIVFLISDFHEPHGVESHWDTALRRIGLHHDVAALLVRDPHEADLPAGGLLRLRDPESGASQIVDAAHAARALAQADHDRRDHLRARLRTAAIDFVDMPTDEEYLHKLVSLFRTRMHRQ
jgi:uncharacterized protein (DUF58 family)